jgi:hypothetical protein
MGSGGGEADSLGVPQGISGRLRPESGLSWSNSDDREMPEVIDFRGATFVSRDRSQVVIIVCLESVVAHRTSKAGWNTTVGLNENSTPKTASVFPVKSLQAGQEGVVYLADLPPTAPSMLGSLVLSAACEEMAIRKM